MADGQAVLVNSKEGGEEAGEESSVAHVTYLKDYCPPNFFIDSTHLSFDLQADKTTVQARLSLRKNPATTQQDNNLELQGESLRLRSVALDGRELTEGDYCLSDSALSLEALPERCELEIVTEILPQENLTLEGLYLSDGMYCTQCEAEGFRRITYYLDRPDVMSVFTTKIIADAQQYPVLLSNGNQTACGVTEEGRHWVEWHDPHKKPCYLFALVAGDLAVTEATFTTTSGREVALQIYVEEKDLDKCSHAMASLQAAMRWDERCYGREYDLDLYMIVAVDFFNMGAMENKGLNIFNTSCVLAHPSTQTDLAFQRVEGVVAHEYFHNWSGNRVTCRDWFQLSLKEGFTVYRDACFSADMNSATVKRIEDVSVLRSAQFAEDAGPMAHPVRPESYIEISNFYTLTIYEKGAEVIRMMEQLLGVEEFRAGSDLYFQRHDGEAVTCEDFVCAMEQASGIDLTQFRLWYSQSGTPQLAVDDHWDGETGRYTLTVSQSCPATPGQQNKAPFFIPLRLALVADDGLQLLSCSDTAVEMLPQREALLSLSGERQTWCFEGLSSRPVPSLLRGFSAPVKLFCDYSAQDLLLLLRHDNDGFVRWDASRRYLLQLITAHVERRCAIDSEAGLRAVDALSDVLIELLDEGFSSEGWRDDGDAALLAEMLRLPSYAYIVEQFDCVDMTAIQQAVELLRRLLAERLESSLQDGYLKLDRQLKSIGDYRPVATDIALRSLKNTCLSHLLCLSDTPALEWAQTQYRVADNMTDQSAALSAIASCPSPQAEQLAAQLFDDFYRQWSNESLVVNQWLSLQACRDRPDALSRLVELMDHPAYDDTNPNKVRSLIGAFCGRNLAQFHAADGQSYRLLADEVIRLNALNPQLAARLLSPLTAWRRFVLPQCELMQRELQRVLGSPVLSADVYEVASKSLSQN